MLHSRCDRIVRDDGARVEIDGVTELQQPPAGTCMGHAHRGGRFTMPARTRAGEEVETMNRTQLPDVNPGAQVVTADGSPLGVVSNVGDVSFKVHARLSRDYWLGRDYVVNATADQVAMSFEKSDLKAYKLPDPGKITVKDATEESLIDNVLPEEEQLEQRRRMEEELERQRGAARLDDRSGTQ
jgi:hypothetical protein